MSSTWTPAASSQPQTIAYFSMEIGLDAAMPTYSGGLGVLAGDTLRAAADLGVPMAAVTLVHRKGYFRQHLDASGNQTESPYMWSPERVLEPVAQQVTVEIEGRPVRVRAWRATITGAGGATVPVYFLDTSDPANSPFDRSITDMLYGGDQHNRLCQEAVLGMGGAMLLRAMGYAALQTYHMNEGHSSLLALALLEAAGTAPGDAPAAGVAAQVRSKCVFTTHTPIPAGHDRFPWGLVRQVLGDARTRTLEAAGASTEGVLNMTALGLFFSRYVNGVSQRHQDVAQAMFPDHPIAYVTNGVHGATWVAPAMQRVLDRHIPDWRRDNEALRTASRIPLEELVGAHSEAKQALLAEVQRRSGIAMDPNAIVLGFARRSTPYKRADLLFQDMERLLRIAREEGPVQILYGGKAHPHDGGGKDLIRRVHRAADQAGANPRVVYLEEYDIALAKLLVSGVDIWLNTPQRPLEASGTSGMKAALNGVPNLSVLDGWWVEGHVEGVTGWAIGGPVAEDDGGAGDAASLYHKLEHAVLPAYYSHVTDFARIMRSSIAINGAYFNAHRMVRQYADQAYQPTSQADVAA